MAFRIFSKKNTEDCGQSDFSRGETLERVHKELKDVLWLADGPYKNYEEKDFADTVKAGKISIPVAMCCAGEPSLIHTKLPVGDLAKTVREMDSHPKPAKGCGYDGMTPQQRADFWMMLEDPYRLYLHSNYADLLSSGLERQMLCGNYEAAFQVMNNMRPAHVDKGFSGRSANMLMLTALYHKRPDLLLKFQDSLDVDHPYMLSEDLYVIAMYGLDMEMQARDMMRLAKSFGMHDNRYAMYFYPHFLRLLKKNISEISGRETLPVREIIDSADLEQLPQVEIKVFANPCASGQTIRIPALTREPALSKLIYGLLIRTETDLKKEIKDLRDQGVLVYDVEHDKTDFERDKDGYIIG